MRLDDARQIQSWIDRAFPLGETLAIGGQLGDGRVFHHSATKEFSACFGDDVWEAIGSTLGPIAAARGLPIFAMWVFETGLLWVASRADNAWVGVFTERGLDESAAAALRARLTDFTATG